MTAQQLDSAHSTLTTLTRSVAGWRDGLDDELTRNNRRITRDSVTYWRDIKTAADSLQHELTALIREIDRL
jgi:hypothetical protein